MEDVYNKCFGIEISKDITVTKKTDDINNKELQETLIKIEKSNGGNIEDLSKLPLKTTDSNIIIDENPSTIDSQK